MDRPEVYVCPSHDSRPIGFMAAANASDIPEKNAWQSKHLSYGINNNGNDQTLRTDTQYNYKRRAVTGINYSQKLSRIAGDTSLIAETGVHRMYPNWGHGDARNFWDGPEGVNSSDGFWFPRLNHYSNTRPAPMGTNHYERGGSIVNMVFADGHTEGVDIIIDRRINNCDIWRHKGGHNAGPRAYIGSWSAVPGDNP
jgi:prepilin-type processing-associated H-X9-DG protein